MKLIRDISEDVMIATFLRGELPSKRFGAQVQEALTTSGASPNIITEPDTTNSHDNAVRRQLLREARGYGSNASWFTGLPNDITWQEALLSRSELAAVRYIIYNYWIELTGGSLRAGDSTETITLGKEIFDVSNQPFWGIAEAYKQGKSFEPMILLGTEPNDLVVLEGHARLTGYLLAGEAAPQELSVILGLSPNLSQWKMYSFASYDKYREKP